MYPHLKWGTQHTKARVGSSWQTLGGILQPTALKTRNFPLESMVRVGCFRTILKWVGSANCDTTSCVFHFSFSYILTFPSVSELLLLSTYRGQLNPLILLMTLELKANSSQLQPTPANTQGLVEFGRVLAKTAATRFVI